MVNAHRRLFDLEMACSEAKMRLDGMKRLPPRPVDGGCRYGEMESENIVSEVNEKLFCLI